LADRTQVSRYIVLYHAPESVRERLARATPEEAQQGVQAWADWSEEVGSALLDPGAPVGRSVVLDEAGPTDRQSSVVGMSILEADSMEAALKHVEGHHHLRWAPGCEITVLEEMAIPELAG
jgi:hypothetical protein